MFVTSGLTKSRTIPGPQYFMKHEYRTTGPSWIPYSSVKSDIAGTQVTESDRNRWPIPKGKDIGDHGSEFFTQRKEIVNSTFPFSVINIKPYAPSNTTGRLSGSWVANCFDTVPHTNYYGVPALPLKFSFPPDLSSSRSALNVKGSIAVSLCSPGNQIANAASAVGELLQKVPNIPGVALWESRVRALGTLAAGADEFLNYIFGIQPTIGDMGDFLKGVHKIDKVVDQFVRDSGRSVRREFRFPIEKETTETVLTEKYSPAGMAIAKVGLYPYNWFGQVTPRPLPARQTIRTRVTEREIWFSGAFTYHLPSGYDAHSPGDRRRLMAQLFGAKPDLNTIWQLTPWSWAVDWFTDAGLFINNLQQYINYGTVLRYGYVMETTTTTDTFTAGEVAAMPVAPHLSGFTPPYPAVSPISLRTTTKKRIQATPFGFGLDWNGLSSIQQAIIAALGISRAVR